MTVTLTYGRLGYGPSPWQRVDLYGPAEPEHVSREATGARDQPDGSAVPVVLVHGGFWRHDRTAQDLEPLACALVGRGHRVAVLEYRPTWNGGAWPGAADDCRAALRALEQHDARWAGATLVGHSAGGHLLLAAVAGTARAATAVLLAPVTDLAEAARLAVGGGAVEEFLAAHLAAGGTYEQATPEPDPADLRSLTVVAAEHDQAIPARLTEHQLARWSERGLAVTSVTAAAARHMHLVNPERPACRTVVLPLLAGHAANAEE
ncbi:alpha/beta hydrolase fold domain-containing protein [Streptomyces sp. NPDC059597]|uniref:alpha/beta hydrolase fold domain-containing protein n=1 Tax=Streptomyces sp. NPDC059597 TaxID=3346879 RepID=UPI00367C7401